MVSSTALSAQSLTALNLTSCELEAEIASRHLDVAELLLGGRVGKGQGGEEGTDDE
jgi:hypothetical protein